MRNIKETAISLEKKMWDAAIKGDSKAFVLVVEEDAIMVCGGYRCLGKEYAKYIKEKPMDSYEFLQFEVVEESEQFLQVHYVVKVSAKTTEFAGEFQVTSTWKKIDGNFKLIFNMDSRIIK